MTLPKGTVLVLGATSPIARETAAGFARRGFDLYLTGRDTEECERIGRDLQVRFGVKARWGLFDAGDHASHEALVRSVRDETADGLVGAVVAFGLLGDQHRAEHDFAHAREIIEVNFLGAASILTQLANTLEEKGEGFIVGISSVAGDRGRQSNYVYGSAKAGLTAFLQGLRGRLAARGVRVLTVKPGFVDTKMIFGKPGLFAVASPKRVGEGIVRALEAGHEVAYLPGFWRGIMTVVRHVPERVFKHAKM